MEAGYMVSFFARNNFDYDVEDVSDRPLAARLAVPTDSPDICGFKFTSSKHSPTHNPNSKDSSLCQNQRIA